MMCTVAGDRCGGRCEGRMGGRAGKLKRAEAGGDCGGGWAGTDLDAGGGRHVGGEEEVVTQGS